MVLSKKLVVIMDMDITTMDIHITMIVINLSPCLFWDLAEVTYSHWQ
jgi:hypothetical protein